jgi:hypothetical protein
MNHSIRPVTWRSFALLAAATFALTACLGTETGPTTAEKKQSDSVAAAGTEKLDDVFGQMTSSQFRYGEDLTELQDANATFSTALKLNPDNDEARVGAAITGVLLAVQSQRLVDLMNRAADSRSPLDFGVTQYAPLARISIMNELAAETFPEIHELQDAVADTLLPALEDAIRHLRDVHANDDFSMILTLDGSAKELDHAEISVMLSGFMTLHALVTLVLAYDLDFDQNGSYAYLDVIEGIDDWDSLSNAEKVALNTLTGFFGTSSPFLAVRPAWKTRLAKVDDNIDEALGILHDGLASIKTETDAQADDILRLCAPFSGVQSGCISQSALNNGLDGIDSVRKYLNQPYPVPLADTIVRVNYAAYFNVQDYKKMLPYYRFYDAGVWSSDKPVFYFTTPGGAETGNLKTVSDMMDRANDQDWSPAKLIDSLKPVIRWQDPTFQGFLPGVTEARLWRIIQISAEWEEDEYEEDWAADTSNALAKSENSGSRKRILSLSSFLNPRFPLMLTRN